jgi:hypothetical protein
MKNNRPVRENIVDPDRPDLIYEYERIDLLLDYQKLITADLGIRNIHPFDSFTGETLALLKRRHEIINSPEGKKLGIKLKVDNE